MRIKIRNWNIAMISIIIILLILVPSSNAQDLTGNEILKKEDENQPNTQIMVSEMTIVHKSGAKRVRTIKVWVKGDDSTFVRFLTPANVKGTSFLSLNDNDWLYLPALKKVRRIATKDKGGSFMGSDFSYDDVGGMSLVDDYNAKLLDTEKYKDRDCYVLELIPKNPAEVTYSKQKQWIDKENFYSLKTEYYDLHGDLLKIFYSSNIEQVDGFWITKRNEMQNVQKGSKTIIVNKEIQLNSEIPDKMFTTRQLERK
ncbi:MAG: outer membrane lipoprotein-sorting protein [Candidatus Marinimicrobia bacterium]|nr:outer membrane lipoprotein-sorting protein [Candidatus Neomarinimicrobiota bacterium]